MESKSDSVPPETDEVEKPIDEPQPSTSNSPSPAELATEPATETVGEMTVTEEMKQEEAKLHEETMKEEEQRKKEQEQVSNFFYNDIL